MKKTLVIIAARGMGDLIYHLPLLRSLYESYKKKGPTFISLKTDKQINKNW